MTENQNIPNKNQEKHSNKYLPLRAKIIIGNLLIVLMAVSVMAYLETRQTTFNTVSVILILLSVAALVSNGLAKIITSPIEKLTIVAKEIESGNLDARASVKTGDEIEILGATLNNITATTQELIKNLEGKVAERTKSLEKRILQIQAVAEVGQAVASQHDLEELLIRTTHLISRRFDYYHVGIFLLDPRSEFAILRAANSGGGAKMIDRGHQLRVGREGIVGMATSTGEARIALDVGEDAVYFDNPELTHTHSEMALPLIAGGEILGALDIQSTETNAFSKADIPTLQVLADQLATAVQNARLLRETSEALISARKATREISQEGWQSILQDIEVPGYISTLQGDLLHADENVNAEIKNQLIHGEVVLSSDRKTINVPLVTHGQTIGMLRLSKSVSSSAWTTEQLTLVETLSEQLSITLENARLLESVQKRAALERAIAETSVKIGAAKSVESVLQTSVEELGRRLSLHSGITIKMVETNGNLEQKNSSHLL